VPWLRDTIVIGTADQHEIRAFWGDDEPGTVGL
jgi:hypothetical protein